MNHNSMLEAEIVACEQQLYKAQLSSDVALLQELLSDELMFVAPSGEIITKQMDLELHRSGGMKVTSLEPQELEIRTLNNAGVAIAKIFLTGSFQGESFSSNFRYTRVWHYTDKGWRIIAGHCSAIS